MGEEKKQVPAKLDVADIEQIDAELRKYPLGADARIGRSTFIRHAVREYLRMLRAGMVSLTPDEGNGVPSGEHSVHQQNFDFADVHQRKPLQRVGASGTANGSLGRRIAKSVITHRSRHGAHEAVGACGTSFRFRSVAA